MTADAHAGQTPSQTVGPFFSFALDRPGLADVAPGAPAGDRIHLVGRVVDGDGTGVPDAIVELWQAAPDGSFAEDSVGDGVGSRDGDGAFRGFGRACTDGEGAFAFTTVLPGPVPAADGTLQAPHVTLAVFARGLLRHAYTRAYFGVRDHDDAAGDPTLAAVAPERRSTLFARAEPDRRYRFDINLQGPDETVFFDV